MANKLNNDLYLLAGEIVSTANRKIEKAWFEKVDLLLKCHFGHKSFSADVWEAALGLDTGWVANSDTPVGAMTALKIMIEVKPVPERFRDSEAEPVHNPRDR